MFAGVRRERRHHFWQRSAAVTDVTSPIFRISISHAVSLILLCRKRRIFSPYSRTR